MRVLLVRFSSLGDIILQTSFVSWLKLEFPQVKISFLTLEGHQDILMGHPHIDEILTYQKKRGAKDVAALFNYCRRELVKKKFNLLLDLHGTTRSFLIRCFLPEVQALPMDKRRLERFLLVKTKINLLKNELGLRDRQIVDLAWAFNRSWDRSALENFAAESFAGSSSIISSSVSLNRVPEENLVIIAPGASFAPKRWPVERFVELAGLLLEQTSARIAVLGGPSDDFCAAFNPLQARFPDRLKNMQGKLSLKESMLETAKASLVIGNDSLFGHVAESCSIPSFVVFGPTSEDFGFAPQLARSRTFSVDNLWCRPCSTTGKAACFRKKQYCMLDVPVLKVFNAAKELLNKGPVRV